MKVGDLVQLKPDGSCGIIIKETDSRQRSYHVLWAGGYMTRAWANNLKIISKN